MSFSKIAETILKAIQAKSREEPIKRIKEYLRQMDFSPVLFDGSMTLTPFDELSCYFRNQFAIVGHALWLDVLTQVYYVRIGHPVGDWKSIEPVEIFFACSVEFSLIPVPHLESPGHKDIQPPSKGQLMKRVSSHILND